MYTDVYMYYTDYNTQRCQNNEEQIILNTGF